MLYCDEETRHAFHQAPALLQVVCQIFESALAKRGQQVEVFDMDVADDMAIVALLRAENASPDDIEAAAEEANHMFLRNDNLPTVLPHDKEQGLVIVRVTDSSDFAQPH